MTSPNKRARMAAKRAREAAKRKRKTDKEEKKKQRREDGEASDIEIVEHVRGDEEDEA